MQKLSSFRGKTKNRPKKSLSTWLFHAALQFGMCIHVLSDRGGSLIEFKDRSWQFFQQMSMGQNV